MCYFKLLFLVLVFSLKVSNFSLLKFLIFGFLRYRVELQSAVMKVFVSWLG